MPVARSELPEAAAPAVHSRSKVDLYLVTLAICCALISVAALQKGTWIDEYWTVWKTDPALSLREALLNRSLPDVGHPPLFDVVVWLLSPVTGPSIIARRFINAVFLIALLLPTFAIMRSRLSPNHYRAIMLIAVLASPFVVAKFAEHRAYFGNACAILALILTTREIFLRSLCGEALGAGLLAWFAFTAFVATNIDYTSALVAIPLMLTAAATLFGSHRPTAILIVLTATLCVLILGLQLMLAIQMGFTVPSSDVPVLRGIAALIVAGLSGLIVASPLLWAAARNAVANGAASTPVAEARRRFALTLALSSLIVAAAFILVEIVSRALLARHAVPAIPLGASLIVELGTLTAIPRAASIGVCVVALASTAVMTSIKRLDGGWETYAPLMASEAAACPSTRIVAVNGKLLVNGFERWPYVGMDESIDATFEGVADRWDIPLTIARPNASNAVSSNCPTIVWVEHNFSRPDASNREIATAAGLRLSDEQLRGAKRFNGPQARNLLIIPSEIPRA